MCTYPSRKDQENPALAGPKSQFSQVRREIGYYLLILREKYGIMGVYPGMTIGTMATFLHDEGIVSHWLLVAGWLSCKVGLRKDTLRYYQEHPGGASQKAIPKPSIHRLSNKQYRSHKNPPKRRKGWFSRIRY